MAIRLNNLAQLLQDTNRHAEAEPILKRALKIMERSFGSDHLNMKTVAESLALCESANAQLENKSPKHFPRTTSCFRSVALIGREGWCHE
ncbi:MAG: tetratricopeptide repeat protein [Hyphomonadaceae bacterium]|nr:tetratricopeptide repeat protein [Hyphomonadaceae bacterium]